MIVLKTPVLNRTFYKLVIYSNMYAYYILYKLYIYIYIYIYIHIYSDALTDSVG